MENCKLNKDCVIPFINYIDSGFGTEIGLNNVLTVAPSDFGYEGRYDRELMLILIDK